ncbi:MAG: FAD-binding protein, partial [Rhizobium sp.]|nr:FAD-binding protein [Rhizobium sp.]
GGVGHLYAVTTTPAEARGTGLGMAARAGAVIADPEFVQFHPTAIDIGLDPAPLATEALRGDGAVLVNRAGHRFMADLHPDAELAPRDIVARGVFAEVAAGRGAFLDCTKAVGKDFAHHFPTVHASCIAAGIDPVTQAIPVVPAVHYHMGGVAVDADGRTSLDGLWAAGEVTSSGVHGANRLASNSLLEAVVFAGRIADSIKGMLPESSLFEWPKAAGENDDLVTLEDSAELRELRHLMSTHAGVIRNEEGLKTLIRELARLERARPRVRFSNITATARLIAVGALERQESRGAQMRSDYPATDDAWHHRTHLTLREADRIAAEITG